MSIMPDNQIDYSFFGPGAKRRQRYDAQPRHHAKVIRRRMESSETETETDIDASDSMRIDSLTTRHRIAMLALKYETLDEAYANHEGKIGSRISRLTFANIFTAARLAFKAFRQLGIIDEDALARHRRRK